ncbi:MAG TPA: M15 family metallopeptidase [Phycisphaerae bacterium]|nr:M15 family metallopeptidase [Phycisphaerae bacterium]
MEQAAAQPVAECGEPLVSLTDAVAQANVDVSFSSRPHVELQARMFYLRRGLIDDFLGVARAMNGRGWVLSVEDAFRTRAMQRGLWTQAYTFDVILDRVRWELGGQNPGAEIMFRRMSTLIAPFPKVGTHMSGSALDVSVLRRDGWTELDRGGPYLEMSEWTAMDSPFVSPEAQANRRAVTEIFEEFGFVAYPYEFWHYSKGDAFEAVLRGSADPPLYGPVDFDPATGDVTPIEDPAQPFWSLDEVHQMIASRLNRSRA